MFEFPAFIVDRHLGPGPMSLAVSCFALAGMLLGACADPASNSPPRSADGEVVLVEVASGLTSPVHITSAPGDPRLFVVEQPGTIRIIDNGQLLPEPFLDITSKVRSGGERGLLSVAFHPDYARNGFFFVNYTDLEGDTRVERYSVQPDNPNRAD
ncbi:MAG TPA: PQQ-dependent sugar dehydrogenase, partial [Longimicrobiales bacterium]|nr:PQQ-dependent sugar dehydrogenase [Longimicrobiales bacterium]